MSYKRLQLNRMLIPCTITSFVGKEIAPDVKTSSTGYEIHRYQIDTGSILDIYLNTDSTTTLTCIGKSPELATMVADEIVAQCSLCLPNPIRALYLKGFSQENLDTVQERLRQSGCTVNTLTDTAIAKRYEITYAGENIKIHYFPSTGSLNIQGKGYTVYNCILSAFDTFISLEEVVESNLSANNIENITTSELIQSMVRAFPNSYTFLSGVLANIISPSFFLTKIENNGLSDYSWMVYPILRGLEGVIKKLLKLKGINVNKNFGEVFEPVATGSTTYRLLNCHKTTISNSRHCNALEDCYNYLVANRHGIFHVNSAISSTRMLDHDEAIEMFNDIVELIETNYSIITS